MNASTTKEDGYVCVYVCVCVFANEWMAHAKRQGRNKYP